MGKIIAGVGSSHVPSVGIAFDENQQETPEWRPLFDGYKPAKAWLKDAGVTHAIIIYNDHGTDFSTTSIPPLRWGLPRNTRSVMRVGEFAPCLQSRVIRTFRGIWQIRL